MKPEQRKALVIDLIEDMTLVIDATLPTLIKAGFRQNNIRISATQDDGRRSIEKHPPDLVILDLKIPQGADQPDPRLENGLELMRWILEKYEGKVKVLAYTQFPLAFAVFQALAAGVSIVDKRNYHGELPRVIEQVVEGNLVFPAQLIPIIGEGIRSAVRYDIGEEDQKILAMIYKYGWTDRQIAARITYSEDTIGAHLRDLYKLTGTRQRAALAEWYWQFVAPLENIDLDITLQKIKATNP